VKRTAHYLGLLFRSRLVGFGSKQEMTTSRVPVIEQFLAGRPEGPIGMDEMADAIEDQPDPEEAMGVPVGLSPDMPTSPDIASSYTSGPDEGLDR
jgi:phospholipid/cholesterol/gamma-HCH transport system ATP-binding protein